MEIRSIGQGGQANLDNNMKADSVKGGQSTAPAEKAQAESAVQDQSSGDSQKGVKEKEIKDALDKLSKFIEDDNTKVEYEYHKKFNDLMIKIINKDTKEVILEVPPKKILDLVARMVEMVGVLFDKKA